MVEKILSCPGVSQHKRLGSIMNVDSEINWMKLLKIQYLLILEYKIT